MAADALQRDETVRAGQRHSTEHARGDRRQRRLAVERGLALVPVESEPAMPLEEVAAEGERPELLGVLRVAQHGGEVLLLAPGRRPFEVEAVDAAVHPP